MPEQTVWETLRGQGGQIVDELRRLVHEGNIRRVIVRQGDRIVAEFPLTVGVVGALAAPVLAAVGALVALLTDCRIDVERERETPPGRRAAAPNRDATPRAKKATRRARAS
jgi:hypothetical protein